jgi:predicted Zn-dependent protease
MKRNLFLLALTTLFLFAGCATTEMTGRKNMAIVPGFVINQLASNAYKGFLAENPKCNDPEKIAMVNRVVGRVIQATEYYYARIGQSKKLKRMKWEVNLIESDQFNAFVMGNGKIVVYTGLLSIANTEDALAAVIGHEIGHALAKHMNERLSQALIAQCGAVGLSVALQDQTPELQMAAQVAFGITTNVGVILPFSRGNEYEADEIGLYLSTLAGYDPYEAPRLWERAHEQFGNATPPFLSTHPHNLKRMERLMELVPKALEFKKTYGEGFQVAGNYFP